MGSSPLGTALQRVPVDSRIVSATALVSAVAIYGRFAHPATNVALVAGLLGGVLNGLRTGDWEFATTYGALPGLFAAGVLTLALTVAVPLGHYSFPVGVGDAFSIVGPVVEFPVFAIVYMVEGYLAFAVTRKVGGRNAVDRLRSGAG